MKQLYEVGTVQYFTYKSINRRFFKKINKTENHWVLRNVRYVYANNEDEAKDKDNKNFYKERKEVIRGWSDWKVCSNGATPLMKEDMINIIDTKVVASNKFNVSVNCLKDNMTASDYRDWWFDYGKDTYIP